MRDLGCGTSKLEVWIQYSECGIPHTKLNKVEGNKVSVGWVSVDFNLKGDAWNTVFELENSGCEAYDVALQA